MSYLKKKRVHGQLRLASEGLEPEFTKPNPKRNRMNTGGTVKVLAGISGTRVVLWEYLPKNRWSGSICAAMYRGPVMKVPPNSFSQGIEVGCSCPVRNASCSQRLLLSTMSGTLMFLASCCETQVLRKVRGKKTSYLICEDNDPTGHKSKAGIKAKHDMNIRTVEWPSYSPDMNPLDFSLWKSIENRLFKTLPKDGVSVDSFKKRLRETALATPRAEVCKMINKIKSKAQDIYDAKGGNIASD